MGVPGALGAGMGGNLLSLLGMLAMVVLVLFLAYWVTKLIGQRGMPGWARGVDGAGKLQLLWQVNLGKSERLVLVRLNNRCLLLGVTGGGITLLKELNEEEAACWLQKTGEAAQQPNFLDILRDSLSKKK